MTSRKIKYITSAFIMICVILIADAFGFQQQKTPTRQLRVGARNSAIRNIGVFQVDSALVFPKRLAKDTLNSNALKQKGAFFYDSVTHIVWFFDGTHFRRADSTIYNSNGKISEIRIVDIDGKNKAQLKFKNGRVEIDTLFLKHLKQGDDEDSLLTIKNDTIRKIKLDPKKLANIYTKSDSIKENRTVTLAAKDQPGKSLHFEKGSVHIDTLLLRKSKIAGTSRDSFLVRFKDTVKYVPFDSLRTIYNVDDSIKKDRTVTIADENKSRKLHFTKGAVHIDTLLLPFLPKDRDDDSVLTIFKDSVRKRKLSDIKSVKSIYSQNDSIKEKRVVTLSTKDQPGKSLHFTKGSVHIDTLLVKARKGRTTDSFLTRFHDTVRYVSADSLPNIYSKDDTLKGNRIVNISKKGKYFNLQFKGGAVIFDTLLVKNPKTGSSFDSLLVVHKDSVYRISRDSLFNIYNKDGEIKENRIATITNGKILKIKGGKTEIDSLIIRKVVHGKSTDSFLTVLNDTIRRIPADSLPNIYNKDGKLKGVRTVNIGGASNKQLKFVKGRVEIDTLFLKHLKQGEDEDSLLTIKNDTIRKIKLDPKKLANIYTKSDSIKEKRVVTLSAKDQPGKSLHFEKGSVHIDTLLVKSRKLGSSFDSLLVVRKDSVYRISRDSLFNIYNKSDSIKDARIVTLRGRNNKQASVYFKGGQFSLDTLLIRQKNLGTSRDSFLVRFKDTVRYIPFDSLRTIYNVDDSIKQNRIVTLASKEKAGQQLHFTKGSVLFDTLLVKPREGRTTDSFLTRFHDTVRYVSADSLPNIYNKDDTLKSKRIVNISKKNQHFNLQFKGGAVIFDSLLVKNPKTGSSFDSLLVVHKDSVYRISRDSLFNIYNKSDSIKEKRVVTLQDRKNQSQSLHFIKGAVHIDTLLVKNRKTGTSFDSILVVRNDSVYRIGRDSLFNIYNKSDSIREHRIVTIRNKDKNKDVKLAFTGGRVEIDTLLIRKRKLGLAKDSFLTVWKDTVRSVPFDSLWNIYSKDDSIRNTGKTGKRVVNLNNKKLVFKNNSNNATDSGRIGILQDNPRYTLDIATASFVKSKGGSNQGSDSIAVRISHNVEDNKISYGLLLSENSNKGAGKSAIGFEGGSDNGSNIFKKAAIWAQVGSGFKKPLFGISTADTNQKLKERMFINHEGNVKIGGSSTTGHFPARLVVNTANFGSILENIASFDPNNYNPENVGILVNVGKANTGIDGGEGEKFKYGLVMREAAYNNNSKIGIGFYCGGIQTQQSHGMMSRIWSTGGIVNANNPKLGFDVTSGVSQRKATLVTRMIIDGKTGNVGMGIEDPVTNLDIQRQNQNNVIRVRSGRSDLLSGLWLTKYDNDSGFLVYQKPSQKALHIRYTLQRATNGAGNGDQFFPNGNDNGRTTEIFTVKGVDNVVGVLNSTPTYSLDVQTSSFRKNVKGGNSGGDAKDSIAVRISHNVEDGKLGYGLLLRELSDKRNGRSAIGFEGGTSSKTFKKAAIWAQVGDKLNHPMFGISTADSNHRMQERFYINRLGNVRIGGAPNDDYMPARLVVNTATWKGGMDIGLYDPDNYNPKNVAILADVGGVQDADFKYGLVIRENVYNASSKAGIGFYNGGWGGGQPHIMTSRMWGTTGSGASNPMFGIDVSGAPQANVQGQSRGYKATLQTRMVINKDGNVGFGTTEPQNNVHIKRDGSNNYVRVEAGSTDGSNDNNKYSGIWLTEQSNTYGWKIQNNANTDMLEIAHTNGNTNNGSLENTPIVATNDGKVGIGMNATEKPSANLQVKGSVKMYGGPINLYDVPKLDNMQHTDSFLVISGTQVKKVAYNVPMTVNSNTQTTRAVALVSPSDSSLKTQIRPILGGLENVLKLRPVSYHWKDTARGHGFSKQLQFGFIAQEVQKVLPQLVSRNQSILNKHKLHTLALNYIGIIPQLVSAVQDLHSQIQQLKKQVSKPTQGQKEAEQGTEEVQKLKNQVQELQKALDEEREARKKQELRLQQLEKLLLHQADKKK